MEGLKVIRGFVNVLDIVLMAGAEKGRVCEV